MVDTIGKARAQMTVGIFVAQLLYCAWLQVSMRIQSLHSNEAFRPAVCQSDFCAICFCSGPVKAFLRLCLLLLRKKLVREIAVLSFSLRQAWNDANPDKALKIHAARLALWGQRSGAPNENPITNSDVQQSETFREGHSFIFWQVRLRHQLQSLVSNKN